VPFNEPFLSDTYKHRGTKTTLHKARLALLWFDSINSDLSIAVNEKDDACKRTMQNLRVYRVFRKATLLRILWDGFSRSKSQSEPRAAFLSRSDSRWCSPALRNKYGQHDLTESNMPVSRHQCFHPQSTPTGISWFQRSKGWTYVWTLLRLKASSFQRIPETPI